MKFITIIFLLLAAIPNKIIDPVMEKEYLKIVKRMTAEKPGELEESSGSEESYEYLSSSGKHLKDILN